MIYTKIKFETFETKKIVYDTLFSKYNYRLRNLYVLKQENMQGTFVGVIKSQIYYFYEEQNIICAKTFSIDYLNS